MKTDIFEKQKIRPMLIGESGQPFDNSDYIYELKLDGVRCIAYLEKGNTELRNKRNIKLLPQFPELTNLHEAVNTRCILDGELIVAENGLPVFHEVQRRTIMSDKFKIDIAAKQLPASFVVFDILYTEEEGEITKRPLLERKDILNRTVTDIENLKVSRYIATYGIQLYHAVEEKGLEGVVAKKKNSLYYEGKRTKEWIKIKNLQDEDFIVLGYIPKENHMNSIILGQYNRVGELVYKGHVTLGVFGSDFAKIKASGKLPQPPLHVPKGNENAIWIIPSLVCVVKYMEKTESGSMRQPVFKGLRDDKLPTECVEI